MRFRELDYFNDRDPHSGPWNMAADEILFCRRGRGLRRPLLRMYSWSEPSVSLGYFERFAAVEARYVPDFAPVRRWTGGGVVLHGEDIDLTYTLVVPLTAAESRIRARDVYGFVHGQLCSVLVEMGVPATVASGGAERSAVECFRNPVQCDVMVGDRKVAGAGQKRTRHGLLHQGSIQGIALPPDFPDRFAASLAVSVSEAGGILSVCEDEVAALAREKYASDAWLRRF